MPPLVTHRGPPDAQRRDPRRRRVTERTTPFAVVAALVALPVDAHPTGSVIVDLVLRAGAAAAIVALGARARRWTWFVLLGGIAVLDPRPLALLTVAAGLGVAALATVRAERRKFHGNLVTFLATILLYRLPDGRSALVTAAFVAGVCAPVLWSGYRNLSRDRRRVVGAALEASAVLVGLAALLFAVAAVQARNQVEQGVAAITAGHEAAQQGQQDEAVQRLDTAAASFAGAERTLDAWWARPARVVPVLGPQVRALADATRTGRRVADVAATTAARTDYRRLRAGPGQVDLGRLRSYRGPVATLEASVTRAERDLAGIDRTWLIAPLSRQVRALRQQLRSARRDAVVAGRVLETAPDLLGAHGPRRYAVWFTTPAEARELGGYLGSVGELTAIDGRLRLTRTAPITDFLPRTAEELAARRIRGEANLPPRYRYYDVARYLGNATGTTDFGLAARTFSEVYERSGGRPVDGVITLDPYALAAILRLTGPVTVDGLAAPLTADNAAEVLLRQQYVEFGDREARKDFLDGALRATFDRLTSGPLPAPQLLAQTLSPLVAQHRLLMWSFHRADQGLLRRVHLTGQVERAAGSDLLEVTNANANPNKIDAYLDRRITSRVRFDPATGATETQVTVTLVNRAPAVSLPGGVTDNALGLAPGTNRTFLSVSTPLRLVSADRDGTRVGTEPESGGDGLRRFGMFVDVAPGSSVTVRYHLQGRLRPAKTYRLTVVAPPLANADRMDLSISADGDRAIVAETADGPFRLRRIAGRSARYRGLAVGGAEEIRVRFGGDS